MLENYKDFILDQRNNIKIYKKKIISIFICIIIFIIGIVLILIDKNNLVFKVYILNGVSFLFIFNSIVYSFNLLLGK
jgi:hypothetical protein